MKTRPVMLPPHGYQAINAAAQLNGLVTIESKFDGILS
jgi:hypothetical protein